MGGDAERDGDSIARGEMMRRVQLRLSMETNWSETRNRVHQARVDSDSWSLARPTDGQVVCMYEYLDMYVITGPTAVPFKRAVAPYLRSSLIGCYTLFGASRPDIRP